jgi:hypothetical protein
MAAAGTGVTTDPRFGFASLDLLATYHDQFGQAYTLGSPVPVSSLSSSLSGQYLDGAVVYLALPASASGRAVTISDPSGGFGLSVGIVQR